jgi:hypothetical protein
MHASTPDSGSIIVVAVLVVTQAYCTARQECRLCIGPDFINMLPFIVDSPFQVSVQKPQSILQWLFESVLCYRHNYCSDDDIAGS